MKKGEEARLLKRKHSFAEPAGCGWLAIHDGVAEVDLFPCSSFLSKHFIFL